jgi:hypothetical protein
MKNFDDSSKFFRSELGGELMHSKAIHISREHYGDLFSVDPNGREITLGDFIFRFEEGQSMEQESVGVFSARRGVVLSRDTRPKFNAEQKERLAKQYLDSLAEDDALEISGRGYYTRSELELHVKHRTTIGDEFIAMILADRDYVESQIKQNNYKRDELR